MSREDPREMRSLTRGGNDDAEAVLRRPGGKRRRLFRGTVGAHHVCLHRDTECFQGINGLPHDRQIAVAAHDNRHFFHSTNHLPFPAGSLSRQ